MPFDLTLFEQLNGYAARHDGFEDVLRWFSVDAQVIFLALLAVLFLARGKYLSRNGRHGVAAAGFSALLALGVAQVISHLWERPRPYVAHPAHTHLLLPVSPDPSFPSDHARPRSPSPWRSACGTAGRACSRSCSRRSCRSRGSRSVRTTPRTWSPARCWERCVRGSSGFPRCARASMRSPTGWAACTTGPGPSSPR